ncbi:MAG: immunoglobulin domain-containing protein [Bacteroidetes bacterium]|nr:immunoglobulin domain-containing protein [Bacteroidota bacterium]
MKSIIIPLFMLLLSQISTAQTPTFNKKIIFRDSLDFEYASQLAETSDGYLVMGTSHTWNKSYSSDSRLVVLKLGRDGAILKKKIYGDSLNWYECPDTKAIMKTGDGNFIILLQHNTSEFDWTIELMKLTPDGDSLWTKAIHPPDGYVDYIFPKTFTQTADKDFTILGQYGYTGIIIRTDSLCNVKWAKLTGEASTHAITYVNSIAALPDNSIVAGLYVYDNYNIQIGSGVMVKVNSSGDFKWWRNIGNRAYTGTNQVFVSITKDTSILALATTSIINPLPQHTRFELMKLTTGNVLLKDTVFGSAYQIISINESTCLLDTTLIACGVQVSGKGCIFNCTVDARELFYKEFVTDVKGPSHNPASGSQVIYSIIPTSDDGLLMAGYYSYPGSYDSDPWILKTDRYGCFQPGCEPGAIYITVQPSSQSVCKGDSALFSIVGSGDAISMQWQMKTAETWVNLYDGNIFQGTLTDTLRLLNSSQMDGISLIRCRLMNDKYTLYSHTAELSILHSPAITVEPDGQWVAPHGRAVFTVNAAGGVPLSFQWFRNNAPIPDATDSILVIDPVDEEDSPGPYHCIISNQCDLVSSRNVYLLLYGLGTGDDKEEFSVTVFPNPAGDKISISFSNRTKTVVHADIISNSGVIIKTVIEGEFNAGNHSEQYDVSSLQPGAYYLRLISERKTEIKKLIII